MAISDVLLTPFKIMYAAVGTTPPGADVALDGAWPAGWSQLAIATKESLKFAFSFEEVELDIQESLIPLNRSKTKETLEISTVLAEINPALIALANGGGTASNIPQDGTTPEYDEVSFGGSGLLTKYAFGFEGQTEDNTPMRIFVWRATTNMGEMEFSKADYTGIPITIKALADMTKTKGERLCKFQRIYPLVS